MNITPFTDGKFKHLAFGVGYSLKSWSVVNVTMTSLMPTSVITATAPVVRSYQELDHAVLVRVEYSLPVSKHIVLSLRGNGYVSGRIGPMWGVHCLLSICF